MRNFKKGEMVKVKDTHMVGYVVDIGLDFIKVEFSGIYASANYAEASLEKYDPPEERVALALERIAQTLEVALTEGWGP